MQIKYNRTTRKEKPKYIVLHDTGNKSKGADANAHFNYFNTGDRQSSADIFTDQNGILVVNDYNQFYTWHCGDGKGKYGITNSNSVGIEICVNSDGDYDTAVKWAVVATRKLMHELDIPISRVVRHYDASRKLCPASMSKDNWKDWENFKKLLTDDALFLKMTAKIEPKTIEYLKSYTYGDALIKKLTQAILNSGM